MEGSHIGSYRIERKLGQGGMGVVYVGVDQRLGRRAAVKQLLPELSGHREVVQRFFNEAKAAASINHPGIVEIYEVGWHVDGSAYFAMKLLDGDSLARRLRAGPMPVAVACTVARQIASALAAAHAAGIIHRDLKPDNVMLVHDDEVAIGERAIVVDFGLAKLLDERLLSHKTQTGSVLGTPSYMSPEQCRGAGAVDHRTDVYSLGCMLFEMLTGRTPFVGAGPGEVLGMHQFVDPPAVRDLRGDVPPDLEALVMRCLVKRPEQRCQSMTELIAALKAFSGGRGASPIGATQPSSMADRPVAPTVGPPNVPPLPTMPVARRVEVGLRLPPTRKRARVLGAIGGGVVVAAVVAVVIASSDRSSSPVANAIAGDASATPLDALVARATPDAAPITTTSLDASSIATSPPNASGDGELATLAEANQALAAQRWQEARDIAGRVLDRNPGSAPARQIVDRTGAELASEATYQKVTQQLAAGQVAAALASYRKIGEDSAYRAKAQPAIDKARSQFIAATRARAQRLAIQHHCAELQRLVNDAGNVDPEARAAADISCKEKAEPSTWNDDSQFMPSSAPLDSNDNASALLEEARAAAKNDNWPLALRKAEQALQIQYSVGAVLIASLGACNLRNIEKARSFLAKLPESQKTIARQSCLRNGIDPQ